MAWRLGSPGSSRGQSDLGAPTRIGGGLGASLGGGGLPGFGASAFGSPCPGEGGLGLGRAPLGLGLHGPAPGDSLGSGLLLGGGSDRGEQLAAGGGLVRGGKALGGNGLGPPGGGGCGLSGSCASAGGCHFGGLGGTALMGYGLEPPGGSSGLGGSYAAAGGGCGLGGSYAAAGGGCGIGVGWRFGAAAMGGQPPLGGYGLGASGGGCGLGDSHAAAGGGSALGGDWCFGAAAMAGQPPDSENPEDDGGLRKETIETNWRPGDGKRGHSRSPSRSSSPGRRGGLRPGTALPRRVFHSPVGSSIPFGRHSNSPQVNYELMSDAARPFGRVRSPSWRDKEKVAGALKDLLAHEENIERTVVDAFRGSLQGTIVDTSGRELRSDQLLGIAPVIAARLGLPEWVFDGLEGVVQDFDFDGNGVTYELEAKRMFQVWLMQKMIELGGQVEDPPEKTPQEAGYDFEEEIGRGANGTMYLCHKGEDKYCVKKVSKANLTPNKIEEVLNEFGTMFRMRSPFVARTFEVFQDRQAYYVVNELYSGGDFTKLGKNAHAAGQTMSESWWRNIFQQCLQGLQYLHEKGVLHCDIKEPNIMVASSDSYSRPRPVFIDFGLCLRLSNNRGGGGTPGYMPPETYEEEQWYPRGDVFSLGVVFFQLMTGQVPSKDGRRPGVLYGNGNPRGAAMRASLPWERFPDMLLLKDLVSWMTQRIRIQRPRPFQAISHQWFSSSDDAPLPAETLRGLVNTETAFETGAELVVKDFVRSPPRQRPRSPTRSPALYSLAGVHGTAGQGDCGAALGGRGLPFGAGSTSLGSPRLGRVAPPAPAAHAWPPAGRAPQSGLGAALAAAPEVHVRLTRVAAARLGLTVDEDQLDRSLILTKVEPGGLLSQWNLSNPAAALQPGDRIVAVNNVRGDVGAMCGELGDSRVVDLVCRTR